MTELFHKQTTLKQCLNNLCCNHLGFKKRKYSYYKALKDGVFSTLNFGIAHYGIANHSFINIMVGIIYEDVEMLSYKLTGYNRLAIMQPQIGIQIGYLMPEKKFKEWEYIEGIDNTAICNDILFNIQNYAFPFQAKYLDPLTFFNSIDDINLTSYYIRDRYLPILYYLRGDKSTGLQVIEKAIERQLHPNNPEIPNIEDASVELFFCPGYGKVDSTYLTFAENYKNLPEPSPNHPLTHRSTPTASGT